jgi:hypothetical protein
MSLILKDAVRTLIPHHEIHPATEVMSFKLLKLQSSK